MGRTELIKSLTDYSDSRQSSDEALQLDPHSSTLLLQVFAAADYYTMNKTLMQNVPPVYVDIILDPYILNIFPQSLVPTAGYLVIIAVGSLFLSKYISSWLQDIASIDASPKKKIS